MRKARLIPLPASRLRKWLKAISPRPGNCAPCCAPKPPKAKNCAPLHLRRTRGTRKMDCSACCCRNAGARSEEHTSEHQSLIRRQQDTCCLTKKPKCTLLN